MADILRLYFSLGLLRLLLHLYQGENAGGIHGDSCLQCCAVDTLGQYLTDDVFEKWLASSKIWRKRHR